MVPRILVVAADSALADFVAAVLEADGYVVVRADAGRAALTEIAREAYDILITDDMFPTIDGILLIRYLRDYPGLALPIILMAPPRPTPMPPNTALLPTPFTIDALSTLVAGLLARARDRYWS